MSKPAPPPPRKPTNLQFVRAKFNHTTSEADELSFVEGDLLYILDSSDNDWWKARCRGQITRFEKKF